MPEITFENDPTMFTVTVRDRGKYSIDAYALSHEVIARKPPSMSAQDSQQLTADEAVEDQKAVVDAVRVLVVAEADASKVEDISDAEAFAIGSKVLMRLKQLGNA